MVQNIVYQLRVKGFKSANIMIDKNGILVISKRGHEYHSMEHINREHSGAEFLYTLKAAVISTIAWPKARDWAAMWNISSSVKKGEPCYSYKMKLNKIYRQICNRIFFEFGVGGVERRLNLTKENLGIAAFNVLANIIAYPSDLMRVPAGYAKAIALNTLHTIPTGALKYLKGLKYPININNWEYVINEKPTTKWQWMMSQKNVEFVDIFGGPDKNWADWSMTKEEIALSKKLGLIDSCRCSWKRAFSLKEKMNDTYKHMINVELQDLPKTRIQLIRLTAEYHNRGEIYNIINTRLALAKIFDMPKNNCPEELEVYRIKTSEDMRKAGEELGHCIAGYAQKNSPYLFFRKDTVCAQVTKDGCVHQCYDKYNQVTLESQEFQALITKAFNS